MSPYYSLWQIKLHVANDISSYIDSQGNVEPYVIELPTFFVGIGLLDFLHSKDALIDSSPTCNFETPGDFGDNGWTSLSGQYVSEV